MRNETMSRQIRRLAMTGPTGAIGMAIIEKCIEEQIELLLITRAGSRRNENIPDAKNITLVYADIDEYDNIDVESLGIRRADAFIHLAWADTIGAGRNNMEVQTKNIQCTLAAVRLASRLGCTIFMGAGSQAEYGRVEGYLRADTPVFPENGYGIAKLCAGQMSRILCEQLQLEHIWLRVLSIYGPYDGENTMVTSAIRGFLNGNATSFTSGEQKWDYLFSKDAAIMIIKLLKYGRNGQIYCIGSGRHRMLKEYIQDIYQAMYGKEGLDEDLGIGKVPYSPKQVMFLCADVSELEKDIGAVELTPFIEGIRETVEWYKNREGRS